jgi:excisionase family DNA binding protein/PAS domain S-box-containing protein
MTSSKLTRDFLIGFLESYPAAVSVFELDGTMVYVNAHGCDLLQKPREELVGKHVQDFAADPAFTEGIIARIILRGYVEGEVGITQSNGSTVDVRLMGVLVRDSSGNPAGIVGMARGAETAVEQSGEGRTAVQRILGQLPDARMLTVEEVAGELRVSKETVRRWVRSGQLPCIKLPRGIRIPSEVIKDLIRANLGQEGAAGGGSAQEPPLSS